MTSIANLEKNFALVRTLIESDQLPSSRTAWGRTSEFWKDIFSDRSNFPSLMEFLAFRRADFGYGMADERQGAVDREEQHLRRTVEIFRQSADPKRVAALDEDALGAPYVFESFGALRSAAFWTNAITALRVCDIVKQHGSAEKPLAILEIGAGWGGASYLLHQLLPVDSYTIIDLPENLFLSTNYLSASLNRPLQPMPINASDSHRAKQGAIAFGLPGAVAALGQKYDVIVNSFSLQEMDLSTVQAYFEWISGALIENGCFVSFNSHGKAGVQRPVDYPLEGFQVCQFGMFRDFPSGLLNTIPYELVLKRGSSTHWNDEVFDVLGCLMQFGLGDDLKPICAKLVQGSLSKETAEALCTLKGFFTTDAAKRVEALSRHPTPELSVLHAYIQGLHSYAVGDVVVAKSAFERAISGGLKGFAKLRACAHIAVIDQSHTITGWNEDFDALFAYPELERILAESDPTPFRIQFERVVSANLC